MEIRQLNFAWPFSNDEEDRGPVQCGLNFACDLYELLCPTRDNEMRQSLRDNLRTEAGTVTVPAALNTIYHEQGISREGALNIIRALHSVESWKGTEPMLVGCLFGDPPKNQQIGSPEVPDRRTIMLNTIANALRPSAEPFLPIKQRRAVALLLFRQYSKIAFQDATSDKFFQETLARAGDLVKPLLFDKLSASYKEKRIAIRTLARIGTDSMGARRKLKRAKSHEQRASLLDDLQSALRAINRSSDVEARRCFSPETTVQSGDEEDVR